MLKQLKEVDRRVEGCKFSQVFFPVRWHNRSRAVYVKSLYFLPQGASGVLVLHTRDKTQVCET